MDTARDRAYRGAVSSPGDPRRPDDTPRSDQPSPTEGYPAGPPQGYSPPGYGSPGQGVQPYGSPGYGQGPSDQPPHVYNPYGNVSYPSSYPVPPAGLGPDDAAVPVKRPGSVTVALVLLLLSTVPYLLGGLLVLVAAGGAAEALPPEQLAQLQQLGVNLEQVVRTVGVVLLVIALVFALLSVLAWTGKRWARALVATMVVGFTLMVVFSVVATVSAGGAADPLGILFLAGPVALAGAGVALLFGSAARDWFARPRR